MTQPTTLNHCPNSWGHYTIYLVACASTKRNQAAPARDLYVSALFSKSRAMAEKRSDHWFILSAQHHLLSPDQYIAPYNRTLGDLTRQERRAWASKVLEQLKLIVQSGDTVVFLAGKNYREELIPALQILGCNVETPMEGLSIGYQLQWLDKNK